MRHTTILLLAILVSTPAPVVADAFTMKDGRYADGPVTVLTLTDEQLLSVRTKRFLILTADQKRALSAEAQAAPTALQVYSLRTAGKDCTCFDFNIAIWFADRQVEVPHVYLVTDEEAAHRMEHLDKLWAGEEPDPTESIDP